MFVSFESWLWLWESREECQERSEAARSKWKQAEAAGGRQPLQEDLQEAFWEALQEALQEAFRETFQEALQEALQEPFQEDLQ